MKVFLVDNTVSLPYLDSSNKIGSIALFKGDYIFLSEIYQKVESTKGFTLTISVDKTYIIEKIKYNKSIFYSKNGDIANYKEWVCEKQRLLFSKLDFEKIRDNIIDVTTIWERDNKIKKIIG